MHTFEIHAYDIHARYTSMRHTHEMHSCEVHAYEVHAHEVYAHEVYAHEGFYEYLARQNTVAHLFQLQLGFRRRRIWASSFCVVAFLPSSSCPFFSISDVRWFHHSRIGLALDTIRPYPTLTAAYLANLPTKLMFQPHGNRP